MRRSTEPERASAGFTLIEVLVALSIVAVALSSIGALIATSSRGARSMEERLTRLVAARAVLTALPDRGQPLGSLSGEIGGRPWHVKTTPFVIANIRPEPKLPWMPQTVVITIPSPSGGTTQISTVRL